MLYKEREDWGEGFWSGLLIQLKTNDSWGTGFEMEAVEGQS